MVQTKVIEKTGKAELRSKLTIIVAVAFLTIFVMCLLLNKTFGANAAKNYFPYAALLVSIAISYRHKQLMEMPLMKGILLSAAAGVAATLLLHILNML